MSIETFIHTNRIYSKCSAEDKKLIDDEIEEAEAYEELVHSLDHEVSLLHKKNEKLANENKQLLERIKRLEDRLS